MDSARKKLIKELSKNSKNLYFPSEVAELIIADRKRILEPLKGINGSHVQRGCTCCVGLHNRIEQALSNAGLE